jgi:L-asparaginase
MVPHRSSDPARPATLSPERYLGELVSEVPELRSIAEVEARVLCNLDSSDIEPGMWSLLAEAVADARREFDGVVIVHGTDTMAYTASALSFALGGLDRPVILTGSQRPLGVVRTDARRNLIDSVDLATRPLPEVGICFDGRLLRGNRATKGDAWSYTAFLSPGCQPLARLGIDVEIASHVRAPAGGFQCLPRFDPRVAVVFMTPGMDPGWLAAVSESARGIVLAAFGVGNVPLRPRSLIPAVQGAIAKGVTVVAVTQARAGIVDLRRYEGGAALLEAGVLPGGAMTVEAAVAKLMHALALHPADDRARAGYLLSDVAGERGDDVRVEV